MGWICLSAQTAIARGDLYFQEKPVSTSECQYSFTPLQSRSFVVTAQNSTGDIKHTE